MHNGSDEPTDRESTEVAGKVCIKLLSPVAYERASFGTYTRKALEMKIANGVIREGVEYYRAPDGRGVFVHQDNS